MGECVCVHRVCDSHHRPDVIPVLIRYSLMIFYSIVLSLPLFLYFRFQNRISNTHRRVQLNSVAPWMVAKCYWHSSSRNRNRIRFSDLNRSRILDYMSKLSFMMFQQQQKVIQSHCTMLAYFPWYECWPFQNVQINDKFSNENVITTSQKKLINGMPAYVHCVSSAFICWTAIGIDD